MTNEEIAALPPRPMRDLASQRANSSIPPQGHEIAPDGPPTLTNPNQWVDEKPHPWRRYFARYFDYLFWSTAMMFLLGVGLALINEQLLQQFLGVLDGTGGRVFEIVLSVILATIPNAVLIGLTGGNFGKWLFGVCVLDETGRPMGISRSFQREGKLLFYGVAFGIPIVSLITMFIAYQKLKEDGATSWDQALTLKVVQRRNGPAQYIGFIVGLLLLIGLFGLLVSLNRAS